MSGKVKALRDLLARVEAGTVQHAEMDRFTSEWGVAIMVPEEAYNGSLDAAKALHEAVLPGWDWVVGENEGKRLVEVSREGSDDSEEWVEEYGGEGLDHSPARAWLIAILHALIAQGGN